MTTISDEWVKIRKPHKCWGCKTEFPVGTQMHRVTTKDNDLMTVYWCNECQEKINSMYRAGDNLRDGFDFGELATINLNLEPCRASFTTTSQYAAVAVV